MLARSKNFEPYVLSAPAALLLGTFLIVPIFMVLTLSFSKFDDRLGILAIYSLRNYLEILTDEYFWSIFIRTIRIALLVTAATAFLGVPEAYILYRMRPKLRSVFLLIILAPLFISVVSRTLGWALLFGSTGVVNQALVGSGLISSPIKFMYTELGITITLVHVLIPYMVIAVWGSLLRLDPKVLNAAISLGASPRTAFFRVILPRIVPGVLSGAIIVFSLAASAFATPAIIGGRRLKVVSTLAYDEFLNTLNWPLGAAVAILLLVVITLLIALLNRTLERRYSGLSES
jgi:putative spermidine/putrescine transport system permease protein